MSGGTHDPERLLKIKESHAAAVKKLATDACGHFAPCLRCAANRRSRNGRKLKRHRFGWRKKGRAA